MRLSPVVLALLAASWISLAAAAERLRPQGSAVVRAATAALLLSGQSGGKIPVAVLALPRLGSTLLLIEADGRALVEGHEGSLLRADVFVYVLGPRGETLAHVGERLALDLERYRDRLTRAGLRLALALDLPPGDHRARVLVKSETGAFGLTSAAVAVPDPAAAAPALLPPLFDPPPGAWVTAVTQADEVRLGGEQASLPACRPVLVAGEERELTIVVAGGEPANVSAAASFEADDGTVTEADLTAGEPLAGAAGGAAFRARLVAPELAPGLYRLAVSRDGLRSPPLSVVVVRASGEPAARPVWTAIDLSRPVADVELPPADLAETARPVPRAELAAGYLEVLDLLAASDRSAALRRLYDLETRALARLESQALGELARTETESLAAVLRDSWPALLPVILLHAEAARGYRAAARSALVGHAEQMVVWMTAIYVDRLGSDDARRAAVRILAGLAAELRQLGTLGKAEELYRRALEIEPDNEDVVLSLAALHEKLGRAAEAVATLESLGVERLGAEGRLRLALNYQRLRRRDRAERILRQLYRGRGPEWVRILAAQELAKTALDRGDAGGAAEILRRSLGRWPGHRRLQLQLAYALDRLERPEEALELLEEVASAPSSRGGGERVRFNEWPRTKLDEERRETAELAAERLPELRRALEVFRASGR